MTTQKEFEERISRLEREVSRLRQSREPREYLDWLPACSECGIVYIDNFIHEGKVYCHVCREE
jgi:hypothetical protein